MSAVSSLASAYGILQSFRDLSQTRVKTTPDSNRALLACLGCDVSTEAQAAEVLAAHRATAAARPLPQWMVLTPNRGRVLKLPGQSGAYRIEREDGTTLQGAFSDALDLPGLPMGYHRLTLGPYATTLLVAPRRLPDPARGWGVTLPLYGLRSPEEGGLADYTDLEVAATGLHRLGADFIGFNPIHAGFPTDATAISPYSPSHRRRPNILHIATPEFRGVETGELILNGNEIPAKFQALKDLHHRGAPVESLGDTDPSLLNFALHQVLSDRFGPYWNTWPEAFQNPNSPQVRALVNDAPEALDFHIWAQKTAAAQLARAAKNPLYLDLAVGTHPHGAETWMDRDTFIPGASLGAPGDAFSPGGQTWGLSGFNPATLENTGFQAFAETLRAQMTHAAVLRIDHILGFERVFLVPDAAPGAYLKMPRDALLAVTRIEAIRAGCIVVGEDLGNVPDGLRSALLKTGTLGCKVLMFERDGKEFTDPRTYPTATLASFGTHDLPTWEGWKAGADIAARAGLGQMGEDAEKQSYSDRKTDVEAMETLTKGADADDLHTALAASGSALVAVQIEDILGLVNQPNLPGTVHEYPNWRRRLPVCASTLSLAPAVRRAATIMAKAGR